MSQDIKSACCLEERRRRLRLKLDGVGGVLESGRGSDGNKNLSKIEKFRIPTHHIMADATGSMNQRTETQETPITFSLRSRTRRLRLSEANVSIFPNETQYALCKQIAKLAHLPVNRVRVTFEHSGVAIDRRFYQEDPPRVRDIASEWTALLVKDLGQSKYSLV